MQKNENNKAVFVFSVYNYYFVYFSKHAVLAMSTNILKIVSTEHPSEVREYFNPSISITFYAHKLELFLNVFLQMLSCIEILLYHPGHALGKKCRQKIMLQISHKA